MTKPSKQRKKIFQAPDHRRHKLFAALLSSNLRSSHKIKTFPVRSGDTVRIMRGDHEGFEGKISRIDRAKYRIYVEGLTREKVDGTTIFVPIHPSKVMITNLNLDDKWRKEALERKKGIRRKAEEATEKASITSAKRVAKAEAEIFEEKAVVKERPAAKKPKATKKRRTEKPTAEQKEKGVAQPSKEEQPKAKKPRTKRKSTKKTEGGT